MTWIYKSETLTGNVHEATEWINDHHPEWDVISVTFNGGIYSTVVYRLPEPKAPPEPDEFERLTRGYPSYHCESCGLVATYTKRDPDAACPRCESTLWTFFTTREERR